MLLFPARPASSNIAQSFLLLQPLFNFHTTSLWPKPLALLTCSRHLQPTTLILISFYNPTSHLISLSQTLRLACNTLSLPSNLLLPGALRLPKITLDQPRLLVILRTILLSQTANGSSQLAQTSASPIPSLSTSVPHLTLPQWLAASRCSAPPTCPQHQLQSSPLQHHQRVDLPC